MKKLFSVFTVFIILILMSFNVFATGSLSVENISAKTGDVFSLEINLSGNTGIIATRIFVEYDSKYLTLENAENGNIFPKDKALFGKNLNANPYSMIWDDALGNDTTANGMLAKLTFKVKAENPSGKTVIKITADKGSTFDEEVKVKSIQGTECTVSFPAKNAIKSETLTQYIYSEENEPTVTTTKQSETKKKTSQKYEITAPTVQDYSIIPDENLGIKNETSKILKENEQEVTKAVNAHKDAEETYIQETSDLQISTDTEKAETQTEVFENKKENESNKKNLWFIAIIPIALIVLTIRKKVKEGRNVK